MVVIVVVDGYCWLLCLLWWLVGYEKLGAETVKNQLIMVDIG